VSATKKQQDIYGGADPRGLPAYSIVEAARYVGAPLNTLRAWLGRQIGFAGVIELPSDSDQLSFFNLTEAFVINGLRRKHGVPLQRLRHTIEWLQSRVPSSRHPLADLDLSTFAEEVFLEEDSYLVNATRHGQLALREILEPVLQRVEKDPQGRGAVRLFPFTRPAPQGSPRIIVIDPRVAFGRPVIAGTGIPTAVLHERWKAGESLVSLAEDYHRAPEEIEEAIRYEAA
jgi:uncharacterized protein (DUF433 family)